MDEDLRTLLDAIRQENAAGRAEVRQPFEVLAEGLRRELEIVAEGVAMNSVKLDRSTRRSTGLPPIPTFA